MSILFFCLYYSITFPMFPTTFRFYFCKFISLKNWKGGLTNNATLPDTMLVAKWNNLMKDFFTCPSLQKLDKGRDRLGGTVRNVRSLQKPLVGPLQHNFSVQFQTPFAYNNHTEQSYWAPRAWLGLHCPQGTFRRTKNRVPLYVALEWSVLDRQLKV